MSRRIRTVLYVSVAGVILSCGLCGGCIFVGTREIPRVQSAAEAFMDLLGRGQVDEAYAQTAPTFKAGATLEAFRGIVAQYPAITNQERRSMGGLRVYNGNQAIVQYNVANAKNSLALNLTLFKVDGRWRVHNLQIP